MALVDQQELRMFALELADTADAISMSLFGGPVPATEKPDGTPVTEADQTIERVLRERIMSAHPDHVVLGEEYGGDLDPSRPTWVIDPIDGTKNYIRGVPIFGTLIGVVAGGQVVAGVASAPALGERWDAARGLGARRNGDPVGVSAIAKLEDAHVLHGGLDWWRTDPALWEALGALADQAWRTRGYGDFWMHLLVAGGMADVALEQDLRIWDIAAVACIVTEAGGRAAAWNGGSVLTGGTLLSTNGLLDEEVRALLPG
jgi:histidinol-phosphatase